MVVKFINQRPIIERLEIQDIDRFCLLAILFVFYGMGIAHQGLCTPWRLVCTATRLSPVPASGRRLLLDAATPYTPSARASDKVGARRLIAHQLLYKTKRQTKPSSAQLSSE
jgi:hypothetical protein